MQNPINKTVDSGILRFPYSQVPSQRTHPAFSSLLSEWNKPFYFIQIADTQLGMNDAHIKHLEEDKIKWDYEMNESVKAINVINAMKPKPKFVVIAGDLVHAFPGSNLKEAQEKDLVRLYERVDKEIPVLFLPGNHDIGNMVRVKSVEDYQWRFGDDYYSYTFNGVRFIVLNTQFFKPLASDSEDVPADVLKAKERFLKWFENEIVVAKEGKESGKWMYTILFQHISWFLESPDEDDQYFNISKEIRDVYLPKLIQAGVKAIFAGHYHENSYGVFEDMEMVTQTALGCVLGEDKSGIRIVKCYKDEIEHKYYSSDEIPTKIVLEDE